MTSIYKLLFDDCLKYGCKCIIFENNVGLGI